MPANERGLLQLLATRWPGYLGRVAFGAVVTIGLVVGGVALMQWALVPLGLLGVIALGYWIGATVWVQQQLDNEAAIAAAIWQQTGLGADDTIVYIGLGLRNTAIALSKYLRSGHVLVVDVYNPQLMPGTALARLRQDAFEHPLLPFSDPRTVWREGTIDRLPLRDAQARVVVINQVLCELLQRGDRDRLLAEVQRVLHSGGHAVIVERVRRPSSRWLLGIEGVGRREPIETWRAALRRHDLKPGVEQTINSLLIVLRAEKPAAPPDQLQLPLSFESDR